MPNDDYKGCAACSDDSCDWCRDPRTAKLKKLASGSGAAARRRLDALSKVLDASEGLVRAARWTPMRPRLADAVMRMLQTIVGEVGTPEILPPPAWAEDDLCSLCYGKDVKDRAASCDACGLRKKEREAAIRDFELASTVH
jgi:hypothetical protein